MEADDLVEQPEPSSSEDSEPVEWLATGRAKRSNAGNRLQAMLSLEEMQDDGSKVDEEEDEVNVLFKEDGEEPDEEFEDGDEAEDEGDGSSSSSDDDDRPQDELEGETQLRKEERDAKQAQKRKADTRVVKQPPAKRVRISEPGRTLAPSKKRKKSERQSWTLNESEQIRKSSRTLAVQNKERTRESLKESEARRTRQMAVMGAAREKKLAESKGPMSQEDRLREAADVEKKNARSLNRWQEMEDERIKRQKQKIEALQNRKIEGPLIRWWSGPAEWQGDRLIRVGRPKVVEEKPEPVVLDEQITLDQPTGSVSTQERKPVEPTVSSKSLLPFASSAAHTIQLPSKPSISFLEGIEQFASMPEPNLPVPSPQTTSAPQQPAPALTVNPYLTSPYPQSQSAQAPPLQQFLAGTFQRPPGGLSMYPPAPPPQPPPPPFTALRSMLTLQNFDPVVEGSGEAQRRVVFGLKSHEEGSALKPPLPELCAITAARARYRDPLTGLPYRGMAEFKRLRNLPGLKPAETKGKETESLAASEAKWSNVLDAWVGMNRAAVGVPESFVTGTAPAPAPVPEPSSKIPTSGREDAQVKPEQNATPVA